MILMRKGFGLIYCPTAVIQKLVRDQDLIVVGAVEEKSDVCPSQTSLSDN